MLRLRWSSLAALVGFAVLAWTLAGLPERSSDAQEVRLPRPNPPGSPRPGPNPPGRTLQSVRQVHRRHHLELIKQRGLIGVGIMPDPAKKGEFALRIYSTGSPKPAVPKEIEGIPVYERYLVEGFKPYQPIRQTLLPKPVPIGVSTGNNIDPGFCYRGTLGCRLRRPRDGAYRMLSNNHVWALENDANPGDPLIQPGIFYDDGCWGPNEIQQIGRLSHFIPINFAGANTFDASIGECTPDDVGVSTLPDGYGTPNRRGFPVEIDDTAQKYGATTGYTVGFVSAVDMTIVVAYSSGLGVFVDQIEFLGVLGDFGGPGDSGSLIVNGNNDPVALLFAGGGGFTYGNPIAPLLHYYRMFVDDGGQFDVGGGFPPPGKRLRPLPPPPPPFP